MIESPLQPLVAALLVIATALIQLVGQFVLGRLTDALLASKLIHAGTKKMIVPVTAIVVLVLVHISQVVVWAARYYQWGELGDFTNAVYFSLASFTTVGADELNLSSLHRMTGALEAAIGMLMFGWSTALLVNVIQRADRGAIDS
jgi:hypothetical protein